MQDLIILDSLEEDLLLRAMEAGISIRRLRHLYMWSQGALGSLLPHRTLVCIHFGDSDQVLRIDCLNSLPLEPMAQQRLCNATNGLALQLALHCRESERLSCIVQGNSPGARPDAPTRHRRAADRGEGPRMAPLRRELIKIGLRNALVHCTERLPGGAVCFALFQMDREPTARQGFLLSLIVPFLHMAFMRVVSNGEAVRKPAEGYVPLSERELEVLSWVAQGKSNSEIGQILGLSGLTVKNHLQNLYRKLDVHNRVQALSRCNELRLALPAVDGSAGAQPRSWLLAAAI